MIKSNSKSLSASLFSYELNFKNNLSSLTSIVARLRAKIETSATKPPEAAPPATTKTVSRSGSFVSNLSANFYHGSASHGNFTCNRPSSVQPLDNPPGVLNALSGSSETHSSNTLVHSESDDPTDPMFSYFVTSACLNKNSCKEPLPNQANYHSSSPENSCSCAVETLPKLSLSKCSSCDATNRQIVKLQSSVTSLLKMMQRLSTRISTVENKMMFFQDRMKQVSTENLCLSSKDDLSHPSVRASSQMFNQDLYGNSTRLVSGTATTRLTNEEIQKLRQMSSNEDKKSSLVPEMRMFSPIPSNMRQSLTKGNQKLRRQMSTRTATEAGMLRVINPREQSDNLRCSMNSLNPELVKPKPILPNGSRFDETGRGQPSISMHLRLPPLASSQIAVSSNRGGITSPYLIMDDMSIGRSKNYEDQTMFYDQPV
ncbi:hypothetical protein Ciccas_004939 [Cichlidogyrus casuarinus]|uniref:Uncharacterized protein n=1 Tax=Cichlidogyrus casuarinus TaxID=1844966 RepID=A0ABD2QAY7_9PLAT